jgi:hypothetical protein
MDERTSPLPHTAIMSCMVVFLTLCALNTYVIAAHHAAITGVWFAAPQADVLTRWQQHDPGREESPSKMTSCMFPVFMCGSKKILAGGRKVFCSICVDIATGN